jgi:hypothetical protein
MEFNSDFKGLKYVIYIAFVISVTRNRYIFVYLYPVFAGFETRSVIYSLSKARSVFRTGPVLFVIVDQIVKAFSELQ